jgi:transposase
MYSLTLKALLNRVQPIKGFVYESVPFSSVLAGTIEVAVVPREGSKARCSGCDQHRSTYDHLMTRTWTKTPLWIFALALISTMRRVQCPTCGIVVENHFIEWDRG